MILGVAKGTTRKAGFETLILADQNNRVIARPQQAALHLIQQIRDEAHRFAITGHKARRDKKRRTSPLEGIPGVGQLDAEIFSNTSVESAKCKKPASPI